MEVNTDTLMSLQLPQFYIDDHDILSSPFLMIWIGSTSIFSMLIEPILLSSLEKQKIKLRFEFCKASGTS